MVYPGYVFMFHNWYSDEWWKQTTPNCETDQIERILDFALFFGHYPRIPELPEDMKNVTNIGNLISERCKLRNVLVHTCTMYTHLYTHTYIHAHTHA